MGCAVVVIMVVSLIVRVSLPLAIFIWRVDRIRIEVESSRHPLPSPFDVSEVIRG